MEIEGTVQRCTEESQVEKEPSKKCSVDAPSSPVSSFFDCSICLDSVSEPVVTLCGHLYCWPCIYKWLQVQATSDQQCPVCKAPLSEDTLVPVYGRGLSSTKEGSRRSLKIPHRPSIYQDRGLIASVIEHRSSHAHEEQHSAIHPPMSQSQLRHHHHHQQYHPYGFGSSFMPSPSPPLAEPVFHSTAGGVIGELAVAVFPSVFRNHEAGLYYGSRPYDLAASMSSPRQRRRQMLLESSLHQLWLFLLCFAVLCLFLF